MQLIPYLSFNGQCEAAFKFYEKCLGGKIEAMMTGADVPPSEEMSPEWRDKVMHASLVVGDDRLMGGDSPAEQYEEPKGTSVSLHFDDPAEAERIFNALSDKGTVTMPLQETFWAARFGMLVDQFGTPWMINCSPAG